MVYVYVCKRFKVSMDMVSGKEGDWVNNLLQNHCKHKRIVAKLERAEVNPKKRINTSRYDSSTDVFQINLVYKDAKGGEHELKWIIKVTRSDVNETADKLLRHEKQVFSRLMGDLINMVKQRGAGRAEGARLSANELLKTPEFIFEESSHQADILRNVLVIDNLEENMYTPVSSHWRLNMCHMRTVVKSVAKFHAVSLAYKKTMFETFSDASAKAQKSKKADDVELAGDNKVLTGRLGLFSRFPFLTQRKHTMGHLISKKEWFLDMFQRFLECFPEESHLLDTFEYLRLSTDDILRLDEDVESPNYSDHPLDSISLGMLESRSFLFRYVDANNNKENENRKEKKGSSLQRSQSERSKDRKSRGVSRNNSDNDNKKPGSPAKAKCAKFETQKSMPPSAFGGANKVQNKFLTNVIGQRSKDDEKVPLTNAKKSNPEALAPADANQPPLSAALVNAKYVTYTRVTRDLAILMFTAADSLLRRYYLIKLVECYVETLGTALSQMGVDTDSFGIKYTHIIREFQQHILYGFLVAVLVSMSNTNIEELHHFIQSKGNEGLDLNSNDVDEDKVLLNNKKAEITSENYTTMTEERVGALLDMMRDIAVYVESKDFELGLVITNFARYHELWEMRMEKEREEEEEYE